MNFRLWGNSESRLKPGKAGLMIVSIEKGQRLPEFTEDIRRSVMTLQSHPGFLYLLAKLNFQQQALRAQHETRRHATLKDSEFFQSGIAWSGWLQNELNSAVDFHPPTPVEATPDEQTVFDESQRMLTVLR